MSVREEIASRLKTVFDPTELEVVDESELHRGHAGWREGGQSHFRVRMRADSLGDLSRIARHRAVHDALGRDLVGRIHALAINLSAPDRP